MIMVVAHQLHGFTGFAEKAVIGNDRLLVEGSLIGSSNLAASQKSDELSPVETRMVQEPVVGVFVSTEEIFKEFA
jgi:hypothetical protein